MKAFSAHEVERGICRHDVDICRTFGRDSLCLAALSANIILLGELLVLGNEPLGVGR